MEVNIIIFGQLTEIISTDKLIVTGVANTAELVKELNRRFPGLADVKYRIAVDKKIINEDVAIAEHNTIALMPPFSGG